MSRFFLVSALFLTGCPKTPPQGPLTAADLLGVWEMEDNGVEVVIEPKQGVPTVVSVIDDDGEAFEVKRSVYREGTLGFTFFVPSTSWTTELTTRGLEGDVLTCDRDGSGGEGVTLLYKQTRAENQANPGR